MMFKNRTDAAQRLASKLEWLKKENPVILAIPRGGVITGDVIAKTLGLSLDVVVSRKIGAPHNPELAIGAVIHDGSFFPNSNLINALGISQSYLDEQIANNVREVRQRLVKFRGRTDYDLKGKTVIIVDDGIATGATVFVALEWIKKQRPKRVIVAIPVGPQDTINRLRQIAEVVVLHDPAVFGAVGEFYDSFDQVEDYQVFEIMRSYGFKLENTK
ncbi:phosphoribosyltransferase [Candidatus Nitrosotalea okcheonensis]|uniref:Phosphoribosyltransferase n=1 Tax=Candidatus Nitrosotalea okcheonensis TaxID=1903276 RepID=A0A2H1FDJ3_9ARCH|nr:phosphoribosyltransferase family protein [Candidatus Nitrosotalea okcheonensis]MDE1831882.1 phosphoribosyltransferase [Nitrososphaerota archaeon]SMH70729.1 Phosphoribosyltransferase [Candidatus Nitrosotalea okcheonensis]